MRTPAPPASTTTTASTAASATVATSATTARATPTLGSAGDLVRRLAAGGLLGAGTAWAAYLALRPYGDESTLAGADGIASGRWVASHLLGMAAFVLLAAALTARVVLADGPGARWTRRAAVAAVVGAVFVLPYYGAETFGLQAVAAEATARADAGLIDVIDDVRYGVAAVTTFAIGLLATVAAGTFVALGGRRTSSVPEIVLGVAVATMPFQFALPAAGRIAHGLFLLGAAVLAVRAVAAR